MAKTYGTFTRGGHRRVAGTPAEAVRLLTSGWRREDKPTAADKPAAEEKPTKSGGSKTQTT
jgi:hypothetical protein